MPKRLRILSIIMALSLIVMLLLTMISKYFLIGFVIVLVVSEFTLYRINRIELCISKKGSFKVLKGFDLFLYEKIFERG